MSLKCLQEAWSFDIPEYDTVALWRRDNPNADIGDSALLVAQQLIEDVWSTWVTDEAATAINAALAPTTSRTAGHRIDSLLAACDAGPYVTGITSRRMVLSAQRGVFF